MKEEWKEIKYYPNYMVSNMGRVKSLNYRRTGREKIMKPSKMNSGYLLICLRKNGVKKFYSLHRLVAMAFLPNPNNYPQVNHKDENKQNNCIKNIEWCDAKYNLHYGTARERTIKGLINNSKISKPVIKMDKTNKIIAEFPSIAEVQRQLGFSKSSISKCCLGKQKTCGGYKWKYK